MFTHSKSGDDISVLRFEMRDDNDDPNKDNVPAATMWSILLPILMDFEELLHSYTGSSITSLLFISFTLNSTLSSRGSLQITTSLN